MTETTPDHILARAQHPAANGRPVRKDEIELHDRGLYIESWLPERRSRRKPLLFVHGELAGSWLWERYLGYFAGRGWEGHALNLQNHHWSRTADPTTLSFDTYTEDVVAALERLGPNTVLVGHGRVGHVNRRDSREAYDSRRRPGAIPDALSANPDVLRWGIPNAHFHASLADGGPAVRRGRRGVAAG